MSIFPASKIPKTTLPGFTVLALLINGLIILAASGQTSNLLNNPGFEIDSPGQDTNVVQWDLYGANTYVETSATLAHSGTNYLKVYSAFNGAVNDNGCYQDYISGPGATYSGDGWMYTATSDTMGGQNQAWIEVTFRDAGANILALYRTAVVTTNLINSGGFPKSQWNHLQITNQYDPSSFQLTNTVTQLVAPAGTVFVRYQVLFQGDAANSGGSMYFDDLNIVRTSAAPYGNMNIVWDDEFNGTNATPDPSIWTYDIGTGAPSNPGWGNSEQEYYTSRTNNVFVANGLLHIVAREESYSNQSFTSARMKTEGLFSFTYGRLEWRAQLPTGLGFWPALWMLGTNINTVGWPTCGEIDVLENPGTNAQIAQSSIHYGNDATAIYYLTNGMSVTNFHTYTLDWTTNALIFYVDGHLFETQTGWGNGGGPYPFPYNQPFFLIMNLAVGGTYAGKPSASTIESESTFPSEMLVDYVRIYRVTGPLQIAVTQTPSNILLSWPSNVVCNLLGQTNPPGSGIGSNWYQVTTTTNQLQVLPVSGSAFYQLISS